MTRLLLYVAVILVTTGAFAEGADTLRYEVIGSVTGTDGVGDHKERFVSNSES
jgi:hypothetical protein